MVSVFYFFIFLFSFFNQIIWGSALVISQAGQYSLGNNITYTPSTTDRIIYITTSNVNLDLNNYNLIQSGGAGTLHGIEVAPGVSNVTISNGGIQGVSGTGILINSGCRDIVIQNIQTYTANQGIVLSGTTANTISNCSIEEVTLRYITNQGISASNSSLVSLQNIVVDTSSTTTFAVQFLGNTSTLTKGLAINNLIIRNCGLGLEILSYNNTILNNCMVFGCNFTGTFRGFYISATSANPNHSCNIQNCTVSSCSATGNLNGFEITNTFDSFFTNCTVNNCTGTGTTVRGFLFFQSSRLSINSCKAQLVSSSNGSPLTNGFELNASDRCNITNCSTFATGQGGSSQGGFALISLLSCIIRSCIANTTTNTASGFFLSSSTGSVLDNCFALNCAGTGIAVLSGSTTNIVNQCKTILSPTGVSLAASSNLVNACIAEESTTAGFLMSSGIIGIEIKDCIATQCAIGLSNGTSGAAATNLIERCLVTNNTSAGFSHPGGLGGNRYYDNLASLNPNTAGNYSAAITNIANPGTTPSMGVNTNG